MQISVTGRHFEVTEALRQHIESKLEKLGRYVDENTGAHVVLSVEKHRHSAEITLQVNGIPIRGLEETHDMYLSVDTVIEKIERQLRRQKEKSGRKGRSGTKEVNLLAEEQEQEDVLKTPPRVIRSKRFAMKPMSMEEAAMQLGLSNNDFLAFFNAETNQINVMYKRRDGNYGLIEPEF